MRLSLSHRYVYRFTARTGRRYRFAVHVTARQADKDRIVVTVVSARMLDPLPVTWVTWPTRRRRRRRP
jgi:hypothetical protein